MRGDARVLRALTDAAGTVLLLKRDPAFRPRVGERRAVRARGAQGARPAARRIRCPRCLWQPRGSEQWVCSDCPVPEGLAQGCGTAWHTFSTGGRCPGCRHQWRWTTCLACGQWSPHRDWYEDEPRSDG